MPAWHRVLQLVDDAIADKRSELSFAHVMEPEDWAQIVTLPQSIANLKDVKHLNLYGSSLVRIPPEIGQMESLEVFTPYTSRRLHWFPYELTRCKKLRDSTVSTRSIYGNYKFRPPFPRLPVQFDEIVPVSCSVCNTPFSAGEIHQVWISLGVATDVVPLLVHACSQDCIDQLPKPPAGYIQTPHTGGLVVEQPASERYELCDLRKRIEDVVGLKGEKRQEELRFICELGIEEGYPELLDELLGLGLAIAGRNGLLHAACASRDLKTTKRLIELGADVNGLGQYAMTPLMDAADAGFLAGVELLLEHGADPNIASPERQPPDNKAIAFAIESFKEWERENRGYVPADVRSEYEAVIDLLNRLATS